MTEAAIFGLELSGGCGYDEDQMAPDQEQQDGAQAPETLPATMAA